MPLSNDVQMNVEVFQTFLMDHQRTFDTFDLINNKYCNSRKNNNSMFSGNSDKILTEGYIW